MVTAPKRIEEILIDAGIATPQDLQRAQRRMSERGGRLVANLCAVGRYDDEELARALGRALDVPVVASSRLTRVAAPRTPSRRAALRALAIERVLLPIGATRDPRTVEVAMFDPTDDTAIARLRAICGGAQVVVRIAPRRALLDAISQTYGREAAGVVGETDPGALIEDDLDDAGTVRAPRPTGVEIASDLAQEVARLGDPDAPTPPPMLLTARDSRFTRVLLEAVGMLADLLEERVIGRPGAGRELARYSRLVARQLGCAPSVVEEIGLAAHLHGVDRALREDARAGGVVAPDLADALGWAAGQPEGIGPILRALTAVAEGFPAPLGGEVGSDGGGDAPLGAQIVAAVSEYLQLVAASPDGRTDRPTVNQLLRLTTPPEIIEALGRVLDAQAEGRDKES